MKGSEHVPFKKIYKGYKLGFWYDNQRSNKERLQSVYPDRFQKLINYGIRWRDQPINPRVTLIEGLRAKMPLLKRYFELNKTSAIPKRLEKAIKDGHKGWTKELATYVHHTLRPKHLERIQKDYTLTYIDNGEEYTINDFLQKINFYEGKEKIVDIMIRRLKEERLKNPKFNEEDFTQLFRKDKKFGRDVNRLRNHMNNLEGYSIDYFEDGEIDTLLSLGFIPARQAITWDERFSELKALFDLKGSCKIKQKENWGFYQWCKEQVNFKDKLTTEQINKLNSVKFFEVWEKKPQSVKQIQQQENRFRKNIQMLVELKARTGSLKADRATKEMNFISTIVRYGVSKERIEYAKSQGIDIEELRKQLKRRGRSHEKNNKMDNGSR